MPEIPPARGPGADEDADAQLEIDADELGRLLGAEDELQLIDIRDPWEIEVVSLPGAVAIPMIDLPQQIGRLDTTRRAVLICHLGVRSAHAAIWLRQQGFTDAVSVRGGIDAYAREVDPKLPTY